MVGVPGKSKGCSTCRRRKKGCGQERPSCRQCLASGYVCGGYQRDLTFILHPTSKAVERARFLPVHPAPPSSILLPSLERAAVVSQCRNWFFDHYLPTGRCRVQDAGILEVGFPTHWTEILPNYRGEDESLDIAFTTLSLSRLGRNAHDLRLIKESTKLYGRALKSLQKALLSPERRSSEHVLVACQLLGLYETFEGEDGKFIGWISHAQGAARLTELQGPHAFSTSPAHFLFVGTRVPILYSALFRRKRTFLADEEWLTIPWSSLKRTGMDYIVDIASKIPGLLEELDILRADLPSTAQQSALLISRSEFQNAREILFTWFQRRKTNAAPVVTEHQSVEPDDHYPFSHDVVFENHLFAGSHLVHWSANLVVLTSLIQIDLALANLGHQPADMLQNLTCIQEEARQYAVNITQTLSYCLWPEMGDLGISLISFPISLAFDFFSRANEARICAWIIETCNEMKHRGLTLLRRREDDKPSDARLIANSSGDIHVKDQSIIIPQTDHYDSPTQNSPRSTIDLSHFVDSHALHRRPDYANQRRGSMSFSTENSELSNLYRLARRKTGGSTMEQNLMTDSDSETEQDILSPASDISPESEVSVNSRHSSPAATAVPRHLAQLQMANASKGEFTFVAEDPSTHYIVSDAGKF